MCVMDDDVQMAVLNVNELQSANVEKIRQLVRAIKSWDERRRGL
jgi:hypothetical protein